MVRQANQAINAGLATVARAMVVHRSFTRRLRLCATAAVTVLLVAPTFRPAVVVAQSTIKLATVVPVGSVWDKNLKQMGEEWGEATGGRVTVTVYAGGQQGDESTVLRKMRIDAVQAAAFTSVGLGAIDWAFNVFDIPFFFDSYDELNYVTDKLTPVLRKRIEPKGFMLLNWGHGGWTQVFTKKPVQSIEDLKHTKLWTSAGNDRMVQWYKAHGFEPRAMAMTDILTGLTTGMIDALPTTPLAELLFQWDKQTPYMLELGLAPVVGAGVITTKAWKAIPEADKPKLLAAAAGVEQRLRVEVPKLDQSSIEQMTKRGLTVTKATGPEWRAQLDDLAKSMRGDSVPPDIFDLASKARDEYRKNNPAGKKK
jgi:TRAP-type C4-dicarboxylate transport system substrate-binding protein